MKIVQIVSCVLLLLGCQQKENTYKMITVVLEDDTGLAVFLENNLDTLHVVRIPNRSEKFYRMSMLYKPEKKNWSCVSLDTIKLIEKDGLFQKFFNVCFSILQEKENYQPGGEKKIIEKWLRIEGQPRWVPNYDTLEWNKIMDSFNRFIDDRLHAKERKDFRLDSCEIAMYESAFFEIKNDTSSYFLTKNRISVPSEILLGEFYLPIIKVKKIFSNGKPKLELENITYSLRDRYY